MAWVRNDSGINRPGPDSTVIQVGEVAEVPDKWLRARNDQVRRGWLTIVDEPKPGPVEMPEPDSIELELDEIDFVPVDEEE